MSPRLCLPPRAEGIPPDWFRDVGLCHPLLRKGESYNVDKLTDTPH